MTKSEIDALIGQVETWMREWPYEDGAYSMISKAAAALRELVADRDSWEQQASDRIDDVLEQADRAERAEAERDALRADAERYRKALLDSIKYIAMNKAEEELCILLNMAHAAGITEADTDAAEDAAHAAIAQEKP